MKFLYSSDSRKQSAHRICGLSINLFFGSNNRYRQKLPTSVWMKKQTVRIWQNCMKKNPWNWLSESQLFVITVGKSIFVECNSRVPLFRFTPLFNWFWSSCHLNQISCKEWHRLWPSHLQFPALQVVLLFWFWLFICSLPYFTSLWLAVVTTFVGFYETHLKNAQHIRRYDLLKECKQITSYHCS